ncbi:cobalt/nickel transport system ATP-binding protein [Hathewaya proteolytica DSM 3090]|uniref:Cobalt/nickel transport system ATP-binding protein n=1 Tax=Hathewaya proteolytica DSM 3090 TaxID=1121331 RepID=A0A1M6PW25_9CLOT|nr:ABC transporter ATP-binding protein [Hathewaya proteolytica]SHK12130.1 cobalt/nickel transport system ATP-binding protein [Hathewaya proteolytica DSM 3090]
MNGVHINIENLCFSYDNNKILDNINFSVRSGESIGLIGANGVGKSTLLRLLLGLDLNFTGTMEIDGTPIKKSTLALIRKKIGYVFQDSDSQLFMTTAYEDISFAPRNYGLSKDEVDKRVTKVLKDLNIEHLSQKQIYKMSGGEKKIVSIGTILSMSPEILLMDEPSITLDPKNRRNLINLLNTLPQTKIIASHDLDMILETCTRTILLNNGFIVADGPTKDIMTNQDLLEKCNLELPLCMQKAPQI